MEYQAQVVVGGAIWPDATLLRRCPSASRKAHTGCTPSYKAPFVSGGGVRGTCRRGDDSWRPVTWGYAAGEMMSGSIADWEWSDSLEPSHEEELLAAQGGAKLVSSSASWSGPFIVHYAVYPGMQGH